VAPGLYNKNIGSLELWINVPSGAPTGSFYITGNASSLGYGPTIYANGIGIKSIGVRFGTYDNNVELFPSGVWCLIAMTWDGTTVRTYKNGQQVDARGWSDPGTLANQINLGDRNIAGTDSDYWQGFLDEFRVSGVARSPSWVLANYNNQWSPSTFYSLVWGVAWIVQEVEGELIPVQRDEMLGPLGGHFRYHVHCINAAQIGSYLDFWKSLGGSATGGASGGGSATPAFGGTPFPASPAAGTPIGGVNVKTANYTISSQDNGVMVVANGPGSPVTSLTFLLPATPPSAVWWCAISNIGPGALTVSPNGLMLDGAGTGLSVPQYQGVLIYSDGSNYYTDRGLSSSSGFADDETPSGAINGSNMTYTLTYTPNPASSLELFVNGVLQLPGVDFTLSGNIITYTNPLSVSGLPAISDWHRAWYRH
jgi:hypothetical protein